MFDIADSILVVWYDSNGVDHDTTLYRILQICRKENPKFNKDKCHFRCILVPFFGGVISRKGVKQGLRKLKHLLTCDH